MKNQMTFKQKVQSLSAKEVVETMIKGLENEWVKVDMLLFGVWKDDICYGCAATNAVCEILQKPFTNEEISERDSRAKTINADCNFLFYFEQAIDDLRSGDVRNYNAHAKKIGMTLLPKPEDQLPYLTTKNYKDELEYYKQYASKLPNEKLK